MKLKDRLTKKELDRQPILGQSMFRTNLLKRIYEQKKKEKKGIKFLLAGGRLVIL